MKPKETWIKLLIIWLAAFPAAVLVNFLKQSLSLHGLAHVLLSLVGFALIPYGLGGWIPTLVVFSTRKK